MTWGWMHWVYWALAIGGLYLTIWASRSLPSGTIDFPVPPVRRTIKGPYRWLRHPIYVGNVAMFTGLGGLGGGAFNALALLLLSEMVMREWAWRERER